MGSFDLIGDIFAIFFEIVLAESPRSREILILFERLEAFNEGIRSRVPLEDLLVG